VETDALLVRAKLDPSQQACASFGRFPRKRTIFRLVSPLPPSVTVNNSAQQQENIHHRQQQCATAKETFNAKRRNDE